MGEGKSSIIDTERSQFIRKGDAIHGPFPLDTSPSSQVRPPNRILNVRIKARQRHTLGQKSRQRDRKVSNKRVAGATGIDNLFHSYSRHQTRRTSRAGVDDGKFSLIGGSSIVSPQGRTIAQALGTGDELVVAQIDLDDCKGGKETMFNFGAHRRIETYGLISSQTGFVEPPLLDAAALCSQSR